MINILCVIAIYVRGDLSSFIHYTFRSLQENSMVNNP